MSNIKRQLKSKVKITQMSPKRETDKLCYIHTMEYGAEITAHLWISICWHLPGGSVIKNPPASAIPEFQSLSQKDPLEKEMAIHSRSLAWIIPWTEEHGGL